MEFYNEKKNKVIGWSPHTSAKHRHLWKAYPDHETKYDGEVSLRVDTSIGFLMGSSVKVVPGKTYTFSGWFKVKKTAKIRLFYCLLGWEGWKNRSKVRYPKDLAKTWEIKPGKWQQVYMTGTLPKDTERCEMYFNFQNKEMNTVYVDAVMVNEGKLAEYVPNPPLAENSLIHRLSPEWKFLPDKKDKGEDKKWYALDHDDKNWTIAKTDQKCGWEKQGYPDYDGIGWYRRIISVPIKFKREYLYLYFGAVDVEAWFWFDGKYIGENTVGSTGMPNFILWKTPFSLYVKRHLIPGKKHTIAVRVKDTGGMGGIWMPVYLINSDTPLTTLKMEKLINKKFTDKIKTQKKLKN